MQVANPRSHRQIGAVMQVANPRSHRQIGAVMRVVNCQPPADNSQPASLHQLKRAPQARGVKQLAYRVNHDER